MGTAHEELRYFMNTDSSFATTYSAASSYLRRYTGAASNRVLFEKAVVSTSIVLQ